MGCSMMWWTEPHATHAFKLSWVSVVITSLAAIGGIAGYLATGSSLILVYGLENCVDLLSSIIVLWRFYCPKDDPAREAELQKREKRASVAISLILGVLGVGIIAAAIHDFKQGEEDNEQLELLLGISFASLIVFSVMTVVKFQYAARLKSASLQKDGICSLIGTILAGSLFVNTLIIMEQDNAWFLDPLVAIGCGIACLFIGLRTVFVTYVVKGIPIFSLKWWFMSQGEGMDEMEGRSVGPDDLAMGEDGGEVTVEEREMPPVREKDEEEGEKQVV